MGNPYGQAFAVAQTTFGLALETTRGTAPAGGITTYLPVMQPKYKPDLTLLQDKTLQGSMVDTYSLVPGMRYDTEAWNSYPYMDTFPNLVRALLGSSDTLTAAPTGTTLSAAAVVGATTISTAASIPATSWIVLGGAAYPETHLVTAVTGSGPYTLTLQTPVLYAQPSGAAVTGLTKHQFSLLNNSTAGNQPPSYTLADFDGDQWRILTASQLDKLTIKGAGNDLATYDCNWFGNPAVSPVTAGISTPTASFSSAEAVPSWTTMALVNGTQLAYVEDWEFDFGRGVKPIPAVTGTQEYYMYFAGPLTASGKITVVEPAGAPQLTQYEDGTTLTLDFTIYDIKSGYALNLHSTQAKFVTGDLTRSKEWVEADLTFDPLPSAADALAGGVSPVLVTCANGVTTAY